MCGVPHFWSQRGFTMIDTPGALQRWSPQHTAGVLRAATEGVALKGAAFAGGECQMPDSVEAETDEAATSDGGPSSATMKPQARKVSIVVFVLRVRSNPWLRTRYDKKRIRIIEIDFRVIVRNPN